MTPAHAQPTAADKETARSLLDEGDRKFAAKDFAGALEAYRGAHAIMKVPTTGVEVAKAQEAMGQLVEARDTLLGILREPAGSKEPAAFMRAREDAKTRADALAARVPSVRIVVSGPDSMASVSLRIDDETVPAEGVGLPRKVNPGTHRVLVTAPGFKDALSEVTLAEGQTLEHAVTLEPLPPGAAAAAGPPPPGDAGTPAESSSVSPLVYIGFGVGGAGLVVGAVTGVMSLSQTSELKDQCPNNQCPADVADDHDRAKTLATVSDIGFAVGVIGIGVGVVALLTGSSSSETGGTPTAGFRVAPMISLGSVGVEGAFR